MQCARRSVVNICQSLDNDNGTGPLSPRTAIHNDRVRVWDRRPWKQRTATSISTMQQPCSELLTSKFKRCHTWNFLLNWCIVYSVATLWWSDRVNCCPCTGTSVRQSSTPMDLDTERSGWTTLSVRALRVPWDFVHTTAGAYMTAHTAKTCPSVAAPHVLQIAKVGQQCVILSVDISTVHITK